MNDLLKLAMEGHGGAQRRAQISGYWFWGRPSFEDLRRDLREVTREIRPDWDLATPGLRKNWDAGDHSMHHPYQADHGRSPSAADSSSAAAVPGGA